MRHWVLFFVILFCANISWSATNPYKFLYEGNKVGLTDNEGNVLIPAIYDDLGWTNKNKSPKNNRIGYKLDGLWGVINLKNEVLVANNYSRIFPANDNFYIASKKGKYSQYDFLGMINTSGKEVIPHKYSSIELVGLRAIVGTYTGRSYSYGLLDLAGKTILPIIYTDVKSLGSLRFAVKNGENKIAIYNDNGKPVTPFELDSISTFKKGHAITYANHLRGIIDVNGKVIKAPELKLVKLETIVQYKDFPTWYVIENKEKVADLSYDRVEPLGEERYKVTANNSQWVITKDGSPITSPVNSQIIKDENGFFIFKNRAYWGVLKPDSTVLFPSRFDSIVQINKNYILKREGKWSIYDKYGVKKSDQEYTKVMHNWSHYLTVQKNGKMGLIDQSGEEVIHCVYEELGAMEFNMLVVKFHGQYGVIDKKGIWKVLPQDEKITILNTNLYLSHADNLTTLKSFEGETIYFTSNSVDIKDNFLLEHLSSGGLWKIDFEGRIVNRKLPQQKFQEIRSSSEGLFAVKINNRYGFVDNQNRLIVANRYEQVGDFHDGVAAMRLLGKWGYIDKYENLIIQPVYTEVGSFSNGVAAVRLADNMGLINKQGKRLSRFDYDQIQRQSNGRYLVKKDNKFGLLDVDGSLLILAKYDYLEELENGLVKVSLFGKYGVVSINGIDTIPVIYDDLLFDHRFGQYLAMKKSDWEILSN